MHSIAKQRFQLSAFQARPCTSLQIPWRRQLALEKAGVNDASMSASDICDKVKVAMTEITLDGVTGSTTWTADGEPTKAPQVMKITVTDGVGSYVSAQ